MSRLGDALTYLFTVVAFTEPEMINLFVRKGEKYMMAQTRYAGFDVPAMTHEGLKRVVEIFNEGRINICEDTNDGVDCIGVSCANCILNTHIRNPEGQKRCAKAFADYARSKGFEITRAKDTASEPLPEIEAGIIYESEGRLFLVGGKLPTGWIVYPLGKGCILPEPHYQASSWFQYRFACGAISRVFTDGRGFPSRWLIDEQIRAIVDDDEARMASTGVRVWKWKEPPKPVREMTVDEISNALGYEVKVVGNEKADD